MGQARLGRRRQVPRDVCALDQRSQRLLDRAGQARRLDQALHQGREHLVRARQYLDQMVRGRRPQRRLELHRPASATSAATRPRSSGRATIPPNPSTSPTGSCTTRSARFANILRTRNVKKGDRVTIYLPMIPEAAYAMLACARIGAIHSVVFAGFSPDSLAQRISDCQSKVVITADEGLRGGKKVPLKANVDAAIAKSRRRRLGRRGQAHRRQGRHEPVARFLVPRRRRDGDDGMPGRAHARGGSAVHSLYVGLDRPAQGRAAHLRRLSGVRVDDAPIRVRLSRRRYLLVHRRRRLGHRPQLHSLWAAGQRRDHADVRGRAELSRQFAVLERHRQAQGQHLLHRADRDPRADAGRRRAGEEDLAQDACGCSARSASRSIRKRGNGITAWSATSAARSSIPGGRPRPAAS